ncbi:hypothetical protein P3T76_012995 [Phytophthora citrophthora]|uniref:Uncharacterized protein n=1 Tax=Phytophthora citrophthora TaxID=4793 RepID=A0AAD9G3V4_9STRA|nr:hypothetical protein P3T76_012995 [Phytophthora citrophthora]
MVKSTTCAVHCKQLAELYPSVALVVLFLVREGSHARSCSEDTLVLALRSGVGPKLTFTSTETSAIPIE